MAEAMIYKAMCDAMADIGAVSKGQTNQQQHFRYRGIDDAMNALYPVLAKHGLFITPEVLEQRREERTTKNGGNLIYSILKVKYTMYARDGSSVSAIVIGEGMDSADKSSNKAISAAMKYAIFQMFCIPTEDMRDNDPDKETPPESKPRQPESNQDLPNQPPEQEHAVCCVACHKPITDHYYDNNTKVYRATKIIGRAKERFGVCMCYTCLHKAIEDDTPHTDYDERAMQEVVA